MTSGPVNNVREVFEKYTEGDAHMSPAQLLKLIATDEEEEKQISRRQRRSLTRLSESRNDLTKKAYDFG